MKYLKIFEDFDGLVESDIKDIDDLFKEVADKWNFSKVDSKLNPQVDDDSINNVYCIYLENSHDFERGERVWQIRLSIYIDQIFLNNTNRGDEFITDINSFLDRIRSIGFSVYMWTRVQKISLLDIFINI